MTGTLAYILARKLTMGVASGISNISLSGNQIIFNFKDGTSGTVTIPLPKDGLSISKVEIDANKHLICTMSDGSTIDAGELPGGGGLQQAANKAALPTIGSTDTLYLTLDDDTLYYWDSKDKMYQTITGTNIPDGVDFKTYSEIEFDGTETTFDLPVNDKRLSIYINGMYLTEEEDYTIDRSSKPNKITFEEVWEEGDLCTIVWLKGVLNEETPIPIEGITIAKKEDIDKLFENDPDIEVSDSIYAKESDIDKLFVKEGIV